MTDRKFPSPEEIQREFEDFVRNRFGGSVHVITQPGQGFQGKEAAPSKKDEKSGAASSGRFSPDKVRFQYTPKEIKAHLDRFVVKQDDAKKALAIAVCDHYNFVQRSVEGVDQLKDNYAKQNVLILGPTGVGKTYLVKQIAKLIGVPFVKADATRFSETGYVGANVDDLVRDLVAQAGGDVELAQYGIIYLDEADKLASPSGQGHRDVSGRGVQFGLLKLMEETEVDLSSGNDMRSQLQAFMEYQQKGRMERKVVNTRHILFIVSGAFTGLDAIVKRRINKVGIGFAGSTEKVPSSEEMLAVADTQDFVEYGFEPEFVGRLPIRVACHQLDESDLFSILKDSEGSIIHQYVDAFRSYGIAATFDESALRAIARRATNVKTGARALMTVCEQSLRDFKYELPSAPVDRLAITAKTIEEPQESLRELLTAIVDEAPLARKEVRRFADDFYDLHGMRLHFSPGAVRAIGNKAQSDGVEVGELCSKLLQGYEYGLKLIEQTTGEREFNLDETVASDPRGALERLIRASYAQNESRTTE